jgi:hypothetical protein
VNYFTLADPHCNTILHVGAHKDLRMRDLYTWTETERTRRSLKWNWGLIALVLLAALVTAAVLIMPELITP